MAEWGKDEAVNDHIPEAAKMVCPHCQASELTGETIRFACGSAKGFTSRTSLCREREIAQLRKRVANLTAAGQHAVDYCDGKHAMLNEVLEGWRKVTE